MCVVLHIFHSIFITDFFFPLLRIYATAYLPPHICSSEWKTNGEMLYSDVAENGEESKEKIDGILLKTFSAFDSLIPNLLLK